MLDCIFHGSLVSGPVRARGQGTDPVVVHQVLAGLDGLGHIVRVEPDHRSLQIVGNQGAGQTARELEGAAQRPGVVCPGATSA